MQFSLKQAGKLVRKMRINDGDVILLKPPMHPFKGGIIEALRRRKHTTGTMVVLVEDFDDMKALNEQSMNKLGWYHLDHLRRLLKQKASEKDEEDKDI